MGINPESMHMKQVQIVENVLKLNDEVAAMNRGVLKSAGVFTLDMIGSPGCGKTALLEATLHAMRGELRIGVLVGDLATTRDGDRLAAHTDDVVQINTGKSCHLEAHQIRSAMGKIQIDKLDIMVIENVGNLICPVGFDLGQDVKVGMFSVAEGDDKPAKHPHLVAAAELIVLNKTDLLPYVRFDRNVFARDVKQINPKAELIEVSVQNKQIDPWLCWLRNQARRTKAAIAAS